MSFVNPTYLWALLGLAVPIAIHLWSKKEGKTIKVGSIQLLREADSKQSSSIQINEYLLLALRLLMITLLVLILAVPQLKQKIVNTSITYIVEPTLLENEQLRPFLDTLQTETPIRLLQTGFPEVTKISQIDSVAPAYWQLTQEMETLHTDSIVVFARGLVQGIQGKRPTISKKIEWIILAANDPVEEQYIEAVQVADTLQLLAVRNDEQRISFRKEYRSVKNTNFQFNSTRDSITLSRKQKQKQLPVSTITPFEIGIVVDDSLAVQYRYMEAAFKALETYLKRPITIEKVADINTISNTSYDCLVWLSHQPLVESTSKIIHYQPDLYASSLITKGSSDTVFYLTQLLNSENSIDQHLAEQLIPVLDLHPALQSNINTYDYRTVTKTSIVSSYQSKDTPKVTMMDTDLSPWLWIIVTLLLIIERSIARYRKQ